MRSAHVIATHRRSPRLYVSCRDSSIGQRHPRQACSASNNVFLSYRAFLLLPSIVSGLSLKSRVP